MYLHLGCVIAAAPGNHNALLELLEALDACLRREFLLEAGLRYVSSQAVGPVGHAKIIVNSWPFVPNYQAILEGILQHKHGTT